MPRWPWASSPPAKATEANIQQFGDQMVKDHAMANKELAGIASAKGATPPSEPGPAAVAIEQTLAALAEDGFDREYMAQQVAAHETTVALFQSLLRVASTPRSRRSRRSTCR